MTPFSEVAGNVTVSVPGPLSPVLTLSYGEHVRRRRHGGADDVLRVADAARVVLVVGASGAR